MSIVLLENSRVLRKFFSLITTAICMRPICELYVYGVLYVCKTCSNDAENNKCNTEVI